MIIIINIYQYHINDVCWSKMKLLVEPIFKKIQVIRWNLRGKTNTCMLENFLAWSYIKIYLILASNNTVLVFFSISSSDEHVGHFKNCYPFHKVHVHSAQVTRNFTRVYVRTRKTVGYIIWLYLFLVLCLFLTEINESFRNSVKPVNNRFNNY
jgi:hypothetical protein